MGSAALYPTRCWFKATVHGCGPCDGSLVRCHLIPKQLLKREGLSSFVDDPRSWVPGCGGVMGNAGHHGRLDSRGCNPLRIPRHVLPVHVEQLAADLDLTWWLEREYREAVT